MHDRRDAEFSELEKETGVPVEEIPMALTAFDGIFPTEGGWFRKPSGELREVLILMPAAMRGVGAFRRMLKSPGKNTYMNVDTNTFGRMASDQGAAVRLLDCPEEELVKREDRRPLPNSCGNAS